MTNDCLLYTIIKIYIYISLYNTGADLGLLRRQLSVPRAIEHYIVDEEYYNRQIYEKFIRDGHKKLLLLVDFDRTLTPLRISRRHSYKHMPVDTEGHMC